MTRHASPTATQAARGGPRLGPMCREVAAELAACAEVAVQGQGYVPDGPTYAVDVLKWEGGTPDGWHIPGPAAMYDLALRLHGQHRRLYRAEEVVRAAARPVRHLCEDQIALIHAPIPLVDDPQFWTGSHYKSLVLPMTLYPVPETHRIGVYVGSLVEYAERADSHQDANAVWDPSGAAWDPTGKRSKDPAGRRANTPARAPEDEVRLVCATVSAEWILASPTETATALLVLLGVNLMEWLAPPGAGMSSRSTLVDLTK